MQRDKSKSESCSRSGVYNAEPNWFMSMLQDKEEGPYRVHQCVARIRQKHSSTEGLGDGAVAVSTVNPQQIHDALLTFQPCPTFRPWAVRPATMLHGRIRGTVSLSS